MAEGAGRSDHGRAVSVGRASAGSFGAEGTRSDGAADNAVTVDSVLRNVLGSDVAGDGSGFGFAGAVREVAVELYGEFSRRSANTEKQIRAECDHVVSKMQEALAEERTLRVSAEQAACEAASIGAHNCNINCNINSTAISTQHKQTTQEADKSAEGLSRVFLNLGPQQSTAPSAARFANYFSQSKIAGKIIRCSLAPPIPDDELWTTTDTQTHSVITQRSSEGTAWRRVPTLMFRPQTSYPWRS